MNYIDFLKESSAKSKSIVCMGADPILEDIPIRDKDSEDAITNFFFDIIDAAIAADAIPGAIKPNYAFFAQYGFPGLRALKNVCEKVRNSKVPLILDFKRGDIGKTNEAYCKEAFDFWHADCVTISPFLGSDSVLPFVKWCEEKEKGVYILNRTSNKGAEDFQGLNCGEKKLYSKISEKIVEWGKNGNGNVGAVVGATSLQELEDISRFFVESGLQVPLLVPGVGAQGGSAAEVVSVLKRVGYDLGIVRINSSSGINFAYKKEKTNDYAGAAVRAIQALNKEIGF